MLLLLKLAAAACWEAEELLEPPSLLLFVVLGVVRVSATHMMGSENVLQIWKSVTSVVGGFVTVMLVMTGAFLSTTICTTATKV